MSTIPKILSDEASKDSRPLFYTAQCAALALAYFALAIFSIHLSHAVPDRVAAVWWPNALMLAVLLRTPPRRWWGFFVADFVANISANLAMGYHPLLTPGLALSDMIELALCLWLLRGGNRNFKPQRNVRDFASTIAIVLCIGATLSATLAALLMHNIIGADFRAAWRTWWMGECVGMISLLPLALAVSHQQWASLFRSRRRSFEFIAISAASLLATFAALQQMPFPFIVMEVPLLLASLRVGVFGTALLGMTNVLLVLLLALIFDNAPFIGSLELAHTGSHLLFATALALVAPQMIALLIEQRDRTLLRLRQSEKLFRDSMQYAPVGMMLATQTGTCFSANPACCRILGYTEQELLALPLINLCPLEDIDVARTAVRSVISGAHTHVTLERRYIRKDGSHIWCQISVAAARDADGNFLHLITQIENIDERKQHEQQREQLQRELEHRARHDGLTGLMNRQTFEHTLKAILASPDNQRQHSVCFIDLDRFKILNDSAGHAAGDLLLRQIAQRLQRRIRAHDVLARLGGDEFGLLLPDCSSEDAQRVCENLIHAINDMQFSWEGRLFDIGASIGVVPFNAASISLGELLARADVACYSAKNEGRNRVAIYDGGDSNAARDHHQIQIAASIREALEAGRFTLYAQRIVPLNPEIKTQPLEMLVRLRTREGQLLAPGAFIPAAERYDLMAAIDRWVVGHALLEHGHQLAALDHVSISINLSGTSFNDPDFAEFLSAVIKQTPIDRSRICFEVTETAVVNNISQAATLLRLLQDFGCKVALDDFGKGLSSFSYLKNFPADIVKIDGGFVRTLCDSDIDQAIVESINQIAHHIGAYTIAEYVETVETAQTLRSMGVDFAQGYAFSKPEPLLSAIKQLANTTEFDLTAALATD